MRVSLLTLLLSVCLSARAAEEELPEGFFEFLGAMVEQDGAWIDPLSLTIEEHLSRDPLEADVPAANSDPSAANEQSDTTGSKPEGADQLTHTESAGHD